jgi:hypothetical protein
MLRPTTTIAAVTTAKPPLPPLLRLLSHHHDRYLPDTSAAGALEAFQIDKDVDDLAETLGILAFLS